MIPLYSEYLYDLDIFSLPTIITGTENSIDYHNKQDWEYSFNRSI